MLEDIETGIGLDVILSLQESRNELFDILAEILHFMGNDLFFLLILPLAYWSINRNLGVRLLFALIFAGITNVILKELFQRPRPFQVSSDVISIIEQEGFGFPSGHVMVAVIVWGYLALELKQRWFYWSVGIFIIIMAWSRMYAGVHYPQDVIGGAIFGWGGLLVYQRLVKHLPDVWSRLALKPQLASVVLALIVVPTFVFQDDIGTALAGLLVGVLLGSVLNQFYNVDFHAGGQLSKRSARYIIGIILLAVLFFGLRVLFGALIEEGTTEESLLRVPRYAVIGLFAFTGFPYMALRFGLAPQEEQNG